MLDFSQLFDDTSEPIESNEITSTEAPTTTESDTINTPQVDNTEPTFPVNE